MGQVQILVVDDSAEVAFILGHIGRRAGWEVVNRRDAEQAGSYLSQHRPVLVLLDVNMPGSNGYELCRSLRGQPDFRDLPVAMFSQWQRPEDILCALDAGADCIVSKDLLARPNDCRERLADILSRSANRAPPLGLEKESPSVRPLVERFNRAIRETIASQLGADLTRGLLERAAGANDWLAPDRRGLDADRLETQLSPEAVMTFITAFADQCWRVQGTAACEPLWRALGAEFPTAAGCRSL